MTTETISAEHAAGLVKSGMWLDYGVANCQPDVFDKALSLPVQLLGRIVRHERILTFSSSSLRAALDS